MVGKFLLQLAKKLDKPFSKKFGKYKIYSSTKANNLGSNLADMQLISEYNK